MKRILALLTVLVLLCGAAFAEEVPQSYKDLRDKLYRQLLLSGLRGVARFTLEGEAEWAKPFQPISGALIQFQTVTDREGHTELEAYISKNGTSTAHTRLWGDGTSLYLRSDLLIDTVLRYPWKGDFYSSLTAQGNNNPDYLSALVNALIHADDWDGITAPLRAELENWLMRYAESPEQVTDDAGRNMLRIHYRISANDVKAEMKNLLRIALNDKEILRQVRLYLTEEQQLLGFSVENLAYEDRVIDTLPLNDGITLERLVSTLGDAVSTEITLPLVHGDQGWTQLTLRDSDGTTYLSLEGGEQPVSLSITQTVNTRGSSAWQGTAEIADADGETLRAVWTADRSYSEIRDESTYVSHEVTIYNFKAEPAQDSDVNFAPLNLYCSLHLYSGYAQTSATTIELEIDANIDHEKVNFTAKLIDMDKYPVRNLDVTGALDAMSLAPAKRAEIRNDMLVNMLLTLSALDAPTAIPTPDATDEPEAVPTETPTPEPTPSPSPTPTPSPTPSPAPSEEPEPTLPTLDEITEVVDLDEEDEP